MHATPTYHALPADDTLRQLNSRPEGLSKSEAAERLNRIGANELRVTKPASAEPDIMRRPPRDPKEAILSIPFLRRITGHALLIAVPTLGAFAWGLSAAGGETRRSMTLAFMTLAFAQTFHLANARRDGPLFSRGNLFSNKWALAAVAQVAVLQVASAHVPPLARLLGTIPLSGGDWIVVLLLSLVPAGFGQAYKLLRKPHRA